MLAQEYDGKVFVVDNQRISVTLKQSILDVIKLAKEGRSGKEIKDILEEDKLKSSIYIMVDTLKYLKKGGRVTAAGAAIGTVLNIKPVLQIQGDKLDAYAKVRGIKQGKTAEEIKNILEDKKLDASIYIMVDTLKYLKKGGRVTAAGAAIGTVLNKD